MSVAFFPSERGRRGRGQIPPISHPRKECSVALVDPAWDAASNHAQGWRVVRTELCFPDDPERSAHFVKTSLPLLLPRTELIFYGDAKCRRSTPRGGADDPAGGWPQRLFAPLRASPFADLLAVEHPDANRTVAREFGAVRSPSLA